MGINILYDSLHLSSKKLYQSIKTKQKGCFTYGDLFLSYIGRHVHQIQVHSITNTEETALIQ